MGLSVGWLVLSLGSSLELPVSSGVPHPTENSNVIATRRETLPGENRDMTTVFSITCSTINYKGHMVAKRRLGIREISVAISEPPLSF